jgi:hypothetical protein
MCNKKFFGRFIPFLATFLAGVFIASFFVTIGGPGFVGRRARHSQLDRQIRIEKDQLREENNRLRDQLNELRMNSSGCDRRQMFEVPDVSNDLDGPPPPQLLRPATRGVSR